MNRAANATATSMDSGRSYELIGELGRGGFGAVFKARLLAGAGFTKLVAIKMLHDEGSTRPEFANRLRDEARLLARLRHRAIVAVHDLVRLEGRWAVVMEYVEGADLLSLIRLGPMPVRATLEIGVEVASALHVIHGATDLNTGRSLSIVHRDLKPSNVRVTPHGEVKLLDFGIARAAFPGREAVTGSVRFESAGYVAPERLYGMDTAAVDVFSLGVVLYEMLAGDRLGPLPDRQIPYEKARDQALADLVARRPEEGLQPVVALITRALAFEDRDRPSAEQLADALRDLLKDAPGEWLARWAPEAVRAAAGEQDLPSVSAEPLSAASLASEVVPPPTVGAPPPAARHAADRRTTAPAPRPTPIPPSLPQDALPPSTRSALAVAGALMLMGLLATLYAVLTDAPQGPTPAEGAEIVTSAEPTPEPVPETEPEPAPPAPEPAPAAEPEAPVEAAPSAPVEPVEIAAAPAPVKAAPTTAAAPAPTTPALAAAPVETAASSPKTSASAASSGWTTTTGTSPSRRGGTKAAAAATDSAPAAAPVAEAAPTAPTLATLVVSGDYYKAEWIDSQGRAHPPGAAPPGHYYLRVLFAEDLQWVAVGVAVDVAAGDKATVRCSAVAESCKKLP